MSSKKGMSADEKAAKLLNWFHTSKEFYSIKEIEKAGSKATGISGMVIKEILAALTDDGLVSFEKIGTSNYYWSYPGASATKLQNDHEEAKKALQAAETTLEESMAAFEAMKKARGEGDEEEANKRQVLLEQYYDYQKQLEDVKTELAQFADCDPAIYEQKKKDIELMKESALRWTEQISGLMTYAKNNYGMEREQLLEMLNLPAEFEDLTFP